VGSGGGACGSRLGGVAAAFPPPEGTRFESIAVSPDGRRLAFTASEAGKVRLWVRPLDSLAAQPLAGSSPAASSKKIDASGGPPQTLCDVPLGRSGTWNRDGMIVIHGTGMPLLRVSTEAVKPNP
jgi:hypothetical protein